MYVRIKTNCGTEISSDGSYDASVGLERLTN